MKNLSIKIDDELHSQLIEKASESNKSLADFVRTVLRGDHVDDTRTFHSDVSEIIQEFRNQIKLKDTQISQLHQLLAMEQSNLGLITEQLSKVQLQLEDQRDTKTLWQRVRSVFIPKSVSSSQYMQIRRSLYNSS